MNQHILAALRSEPWAIVPAYLEAIEAVAMRVMEHPALLTVEQDGHQARFAEASARMGERAPGTRSAALRDGVGSLPVFGPVFPRAGGLATSGATTLDALGADLRALDDSKDVRNILMVVDCPGGAVSGVHDFARLVASVKKPLSVHVIGQCCSAAYWFSSPASGGIAERRLARHIDHPERLEYLKRLVGLIGEQRLERDQRPPLDDPLFPIRARR